MRKWAAVVGIVGVGAAGCGQGADPSRAVPSAQGWPSSSPGYAIAGEAGAPLLVRCGVGQRALVRRLPGDAVAEVECVDEPLSRDETLLYALEPTRTAATPRAYRTVVQEPYREPAKRAPRSAARKTRPAKESVAIIAGSTVAGAAIGGLVKGKKGALIGAVIGGGAGTIFDRTTRHKEVR